MKQRDFLADLCGVCMAALSGSAAAISNGDFSSGDLSGWTVNGSVNVIDWGFNTSGAGYTADLFAGLGAGVSTTLSQSFYLSAGEVLSGQAQWLGWDFLPNNDFGSVSIVNDASLLGNTLFSADIATFGDFGSSPLSSFSFTAPVGGFYTLTAAVANAGDNAFPSELQVANLATAVPELNVVWLLGSGLAAMGWRRRRA